MYQPFPEADGTVETLRGALAFEDGKVVWVEDGARGQRHDYLEMVRWKRSRESAVEGLLRFKFTVL